MEEEKTKRVEIYDEKGLVEVIYIVDNEPTIEEIISQKEEELLRIFAELNAIKENKL